MKSSKSSFQSHLFLAQVAGDKVRPQEVREEAREDDPEGHDAADEDGPAAEGHLKVGPGAGGGAVAA